jgi:hypothetical protein
MVETGAKFGSVQSYDGCGMTCGLDQHIAVYPRELADRDNNALDDQGTLWKLMRRIEMVPTGDYPKLRDAINALWTELADWDMYLATDGVLRHTKTGAPAHGRKIREVLSPNKGCPTTKGEKAYAEKWAKLFHAVLSHPATFQAQIEYGKEHLVKRTKRRKIALRAGTRVNGIGVHAGYPSTPAELAYSRELTLMQVGQHLSPRQDLALCMYQANSVNAPAIANRCLTKAKQHDDWDRRLIRLLGTSSYGRWDDDLKNGRYQRTRTVARASGLWPRYLFDKTRGVELAYAHTVMPKDLPG